MTGASANVDQRCDQQNVRPISCVRATGSGTYFDSLTSQFYTNGNATYIKFALNLHHTNGATEVRFSTAVTVPGNSSLDHLWIKKGSVAADVDQICATAVDGNNGTRLTGYACFNT